MADRDQQLVDVWAPQRTVDDAALFCSMLERSRR
jgi:hypothetical protein